MNEIRSVSISGRVTLDMHSLNNEGAEGNQLQTRMVHIVDGNGNLAVVNAVSGDMLKHIQAEHFQAIAVEEGLALCAGCRRFDANRINADEDFLKQLGKLRDNEAILTRVIEACAMDDVEGILITVGNRSTPRKSTVEFGWLVGLPDRTRTESYFHVKYDLRAREAGSGGEEGANRGQNIFYRPASSGVYALVVNVELSRVGFNDISRTYVLDSNERARRRAALLKSVAYALVKPTGAHRNTQHPHIVATEGVVAVSRATVPAPTASALSDSYQREVLGVAEQLNRLAPGAVTCFTFGSQAELARILADLVEEAARSGEAYVAAG